jgi:hypothetical protein
MAFSNTINTAITAHPYWLAGGLILAAVLIRFLIKCLVDFLRPRQPGSRRERYYAYLHSDTWKRLRREALERDGRRCRLCNANTNLHVHHRYYPEVLGTETIDALTTLCQRCHEEIAHYRKRLKQNRGADRNQTS